MVGDSHAHLLSPFQAFASKIGYPVERVAELGGAEVHTITAPNQSA